MPKISSEHRELRRAQILDAAWRCFQREGLQATSMEQIIAESGLSASAMYRYFSSKDDIVQTAMRTALDGLASLLQPLIDDPRPMTPAQFVGAATTLISSFSSRSGYNLVAIVIHGWSEALRNPPAAAVLRQGYQGLRHQLALRTARWQREQALPASLSAQDTAQTLLSLILGFVAQAGLLGDADPGRISRGLAAFQAEF